MELQNSQQQIDLKKSLRQLEPIQTEYVIKSALIVAMQRLNLELENIDATITDVMTEFKTTSLEKIVEAIRSGSLAKFGKCYKLSTHEICHWIRQNNESKKSKLL